MFSNDGSFMAQFQKLKQQMEEKKGGQSGGVSSPAAVDQTNVEDASDAEEDEKEMDAPSPKKVLSLFAVFCSSLPL